LASPTDQSFSEKHRQDQRCAHRAVRYLNRSISGPIADLREVTDRIDKRDLSTSADMDRRDEMGQLAGAINRLQKTLQSGGKMKAAA
jgi:HAMP domain-containing protein